MKDKLEVGMYCRYTRGAINGYVPPRIGKIIERLNDSEFLKLDTNCTILENDIIGEPSFNPIDLIEVGDYVNGGKVIEIEKNYKFIDNEIRDILWLDKKRNSAVWKETIKSIVTKEQFESMIYKLEVNSENIKQ